MFQLFSMNHGRKVIMILGRSNYLVWICQNCEHSEKYIVPNYHKVLQGFSQIQCDLKIQCVFKS